MEFPKARLLVFAKAPIPGQVKTRLAGRIGKRGAAELYKTMVRRTLRMLKEAQLAPVELWCAPDTKHGFFAACRRDYGIKLRVQRGSDLGRRMNHALSSALSECPYALLIGGDCVSLKAADLRFALTALTTGREAVLGPAEDGGYVLIGLRRPCPALFRGIAWGGAQVLTATRQRLRQAGLDWVELESRWDVDRPADVRRLKHWIPRTM